MHLIRTTNNENDNKQRERREKRNCTRTIIDRVCTETFFQVFNERQSLR
jgi:hypothetical protein